MSKKAPATDPWDEVVFLNPSTCGIYKNGGVRYKVDPATGRRDSSHVDNEMLEHVSRYLADPYEAIPGMVRVPLDIVEATGILVPRYYDARHSDAFGALLDELKVDGISLGELEEAGVIEVFGGHGSPSNDQRVGTIPYIKVSDIRNLRINVNPTNLIPLPLARRHWRGATSGLQPWDLITPNRASSNIGEFAILLPGEEQVVLTKEVFVIRAGPAQTVITPFYLLWAFSLSAVRQQWQRITLMQTNREDVNTRYREIRIPNPPDAVWASEKETAFREYFTTLADAKVNFLTSLESSGLQFIASARQVRTADTETSSDGDRDHDPSGEQSLSQKQGSLSRRRRVWKPDISD